MMEHDPMVSGYSGEEQRIQNGHFTHGDDADTCHWRHQQDMVAWLAKLEQPPQQENDADNTSIGIGNLTMQDHQNGRSVNSEQYHPMLAVSPNTLMPVASQQSESGLMTKVTPRTAAGMAIPRLKTTLVKDSSRPHTTNHWNVKSEDMAECRKWGTKCSCSNANVKIVFRNRAKLEYVRDYNKHNEPSDAVKETLVDRYMMKIACIIKSYEPKSAELLRHKTFLLGQKHQSWLVPGWEGEGRYGSNEAEKNARGKRGNANRHNNQGAARLWSQPSFSSPPPPFPTPPQAVRKKGNM